MTREQAIAQLRRERAEYTQNVALDMAIISLEREGQMETERDFWLNLSKTFAEQIGEIQRTMLTTVAERATKLKSGEVSND